MTNPVSATTGHSRPAERLVAKQLYIAIIAAVLVGMVVFFLVGQNNKMDPNHNQSTTDTNATSDSAPIPPSNQ